MLNPREMAESELLKQRLMCIQRFEKGDMSVLSDSREVATEIQRRGLSFKKRRIDAAPVDYFPSIELDQTSDFSKTDKRSESLFKELEQELRKLEKNLRSRTSAPTTMRFNKSIKFLGISKTMIQKSGSEPDMEQIAYGIVYEPDTPDAQGDFASEEAIREAAYSFMASEQAFKINHDADASIHVLESFIAPEDYEIDGEKVKKGSWIMATRITDEKIWDKIVSGKITGYSMAGEALRIEERV